MPDTEVNPSSGKSSYAPTAKAVSQGGPDGSGQSDTSSTYYDGASMSFMEVYADIVGALATQPGYGIVKRELNKAIHQINDEIGLFDAIVKVTIGTETTSMDGNTTYFESITTNVDQLGRFALEWHWDSDTKSLKLPDYVSEFKQAFVDDEEWESVPYNVVKDSKNSSEKIWHQAGRFIYFPIDFSSETKIMRVRVKMMYPGIRDFAGYPILDSQIYLPHHYRMLLVSSVIMFLAIMPDYKDSDIYTHYKEIYTAEYASLIRKVDNIQAPYENFSFKYTY